MSRDFVLRLIIVDNTVEVEAVADEIVVYEDYVLLFIFPLRYLNKGVGLWGVHTGMDSCSRYLSTSGYFNLVSTITCVMP